MSRRRDGGRGSTARSSRPGSDERRRRDELGGGDDTGAGAGRVARASRRTVRRLAWPLVLAALVCVTVALATVPTRTYLEKKQQVSLAQQQLDNLTRENDDVQARVDQLQTSEEIEAIARSEYQLVKPGEEAYEVLLPPQEPVQLPEGWPFEDLDKSLTAATDE